MPFASEHLALLAPRETERRTWALLGSAGSDPASAAAFAARGPALTLLAHGPSGRVEAVACAGIMLGPRQPDGGRAGDAWALTGRAVDRLPLAFHRAARRGLAAIVAAHGLTRVQALCLADFAAGRRWLARLGFTRETLEPGMAGVLPGARLHLYALVPGRSGGPDARGRSAGDPSHAQHRRNHP
ncbi:hypothetical protein [Desulfovibrio sp. X2]|uniref:hypothetical protein n=1 Tax=Desulfovibrio sp. X2 TaxID=941449 RepID=UPI0003F8ED5C|nr:hypothetical protein [Desulfovibrio sp. X2]